ncbi:MAG: hypothetical protein ACJA0G_000367 [Kangiellaceae bacterium]
MIFIRFSLLALIALSNILLSPTAQASAYVGTQDKQLHYDLQTLVEWGYLDAAVSTFPVPWKGVASDLSELSAQGMSFRPQQAYLRLNHYLNLNKQQGRRFITLQGASDDVRFRSFDDGVESTNKITISNEFYYGHWSGQIAVSYTGSGASSTYYDNSFLAYQFGDWNLRVGSIDQWWGPAQSTSLIMSNNTRPIKAIALSRSVNTTSQSPWLSWMGPWYLTTQMGQFEERRAVPNVNVFMNRFNARPLKGLEIGFSWVAMWGGEGSNEGFEEFIELVTFQNICPGESINCDPSVRSKRGNHIAGFDVSYTAQLFDRPVTFYAQRVGEDSVDGYKITDNANMVGISTYWQGAKIFVETSDTNIACGQNESAFNCYYEHSTYTDGYRMYGRTLGSTFDSDAKQITLGSNIRFSNGDIMEVYVRSAELNKDGSRPSPVITRGNSEEVLEISGFYQKPFGDWLLKAGGSIANRKFDMLDDRVDSLIYAKAQYAF